ncbi:MAG: diguanylate cyclase, partial [Gammaproteobacteria bacterium]|nr:diguanylate cyclase [Gammaproteobacteria bacterium]
MQDIFLIVQNENSLQSYKRLLTAKNYNVYDERVLNSKRHRINQDLIVIDIYDKQGLSLLENIVFKENSYVILISPFLQQMIHLPGTLGNLYVFYLCKPLDVNRLTAFLSESCEKIEKNSYLKTKEKILIKTIDDSPLRIAVYSHLGELLYANPTYLLENRIEDRENFKFENLINCTKSFQEIVHNVKSKHIFNVEKKVHNKWYRSFFYATSHENIVHLLSDETEHISYLESLKKSAQFFDHSNEGVVITDKETKILAINQSFSEISGYTKEESIGQPINILSSGSHSNNFYKNMWDSLKHYGKWQGEIWNKRKNGEIFPEWLSIKLLKDPETGDINYMAIFTDISRLKESDKRLHYYANHDHLTGLFNKIQFENLLDQIISSAIRNNKNFALLYIDLDYFKEVNDTSGHDTGDLVLKEVSKRFQASLRKEDIIARIGGDEFTVIIDNIKENDNVLFLANKLLEAIRLPFNVGGKSFYLSLSIGIAIFPTHGHNKRELSKNADSAMYEVKNSGRDNVMLYNKKFTESLLKKVSLHTDLKKAIKNGDLDVYYQLVVDINEKKFIG